MKILIGLFSVALSFSAFASSIDTKTFIYDGSVNSVELLLKSEKTRTENRVETRQSTCYRREMAGYRTICSGGYGPYPRPLPGPYPRPYPAPYPTRRCWSEPMYRSIPYSCMQTVNIPVEIKEYDVDARVIVDVTKLSSEATPGEKFKVTLKGDKLSFEVEASKKFFVVKKLSNERSTMNGNVKLIDAVLAAELIEVSPVLQAINLSSLKMEDGLLKFNLGSENLEHVGIDLKVEKLKTFGSDAELLNRELLSSEIVVNGSEVSVDIARLGVDLRKGKFALTIKAFTKFDGNLMNSRQFDRLSDSKTLIFKIR